jgi:hypothetical protein
MPCTFYTHESTPVPTEWEAMQDPELVCMVVEKRISLASVKIQTQTAQSVGGSYTYYAILFPITKCCTVAQYCFINLFI